MKKILAKITYCLKSLYYGVLPMLLGGCSTLAIYYTVQNIEKITTGSGWPVVYNFVFALCEIALAIIALYELGEINMSAKNWKQYIKYKKIDEADAIDSSSDDCETSDEAAGR